MKGEQEKLDQLCHNYVQHMIEGFDFTDMECVLYDLLTREYEKLTWDEITEEVRYLYDEETLLHLTELTS